MENRKSILPALKIKIIRFDLPLSLADAIICEESGYDPWCARYEKELNVFQLPTKYSKVNRISLETEIELQKISFGLFQILGRTARWLEFDASLTQLCDVETNLYWGLKYLQILYKKYSNIDDVIASYNAGSPIKNKDGSYVNQKYVDSVKGYIASNKF